MKTQTKIPILSRLIRPLLIGAVCVAPLVVRATPYATSLTNNGPGTSISFRLNESGTVQVVWTNLAAAIITNNFGNRVAGLITTNLSGGGGPVPGDFTVIVSKTTTPGYVSGVAIQISNDSTNSTPVVNTNTVRFNSPRGVAVNKNPSSPYFGRIYVANSAPGTATRTVGDGIYLLNADFSDAVAQGTNARTAGITTFTNTVSVDDANTPYRIEVGEDSNLYIADTSTNSGTIYVTDPDVLTGTNLIAGLGINGNPNSLAPSPNHGRIASSVFATGSTNAGTLVVYAIDTDNTTTSDTVQNHIMKWDVGFGPLPVDLTVGVALTNIDEASLLPVSGITADLARGPDGKFYTLQFRQVDADPGMFVVDPATDVNANGAADVIYNSLSDTIGNHGVTRDFLYESRAVAISPDGKYMGVIRHDNQIWVVSLTNGVPALGQRRLVSQGTTTIIGRDIAFDAAGNLYIVSSGQALMRVFSPGYTTIATTTLSGTFSVTNIVPEQLVTISGTVTNAAEPASNGEFTISRVGNTNVALTVNYVIAGSAGRGADYSTNVFGIGGGTTNSVTLPIGVTSTNVVITVIDDAVGEVTETVTFTLLSSTNYVSGNNQAAIVMIVDDGVDLPNVNVSARGLGSYELIPYRPAKFLVSIGSPWGVNVIANVALSGSAASGTDYTNPATFTVTIPAGTLSTIATVTPINNASIAADKTIIITVLNATDNSYTNIGNLIATNILRNDDYAALSSLYSESFDVDNTANWVVKFATNNDVATDFFFDYSTVGVPVAPRTVGGTTRGLRLKTHLTLPSARIGVSVAPLGQAFSGNYRLRFDSWFNFTGPIDGTGTGSTEFFLAGVGASENRTNGPFAPALGMGPAVSFGYMADGGQVAGTGQRDMGAYTNTVALEPAIGGVYLAGTNNIARDNTSPYYAEFGDLTAPAAQLIPLPGQTRTNGAGILGMCWHDIIIDKTSTNVTWTVDGLLIANVPTAVFYSTMGSNIFFAMDDPNTLSIASPAAAQFALVDNVVVEQLPASANASLTSLVIAPAGTLVPVFASGTTTYAATNNFVANPVTVTAVKGDPAASLQLKVNAGAFGPLTSGVASAGQTLNAGQNTVTVRVTAMDAVTTQDYTVNAVLRPSGSVPTVTSSVSGSTLTLGWPSTHLGYELQTQTNSASTGLGSTWFTVPGSTSTNSINLNIDPANPTVFFRLLYLFP